MNKYLIFVLFFFVTTASVCTAETYNGDKDIIFPKGTVELSGSELNAVSIALKDFKKMKYKLKNYRVFIVPKNKNYEIVFLPRDPIGTPTVRGGGNQFGDEVHYLVSESGVILNMNFAR
ncbi:hypothetical protein [Undibacterium flavidum]|uniref:Uncharacterized protein n=1 Tax=Undibacterium flavidum TaxID=2762297 RepID=A0ABR6YEB7_9BURK|nr:hypothetical protein [Undibacterium flavidum]MBC3874910.1 hypothetical protein [Undibacterium flavidum]